ncbi:MAG: zinc-ribbon domain-containing protein, partial [Jannaschia sp.]
MRLTCPNCSAQYEVAEDMIPPDGRDVQCSNCATTWFQAGRIRTAAPDTDREVRRAGQPETTEPEENDVPDEVPEAAHPDEVEPDAPAGPEAPAEPMPDASRPRRPLADDETLEILRQERAHEARRRAAERRGRATAASDLDPAAGAASVGDEHPDRARELAAAERARMATAASVARARDAVGQA